MNDQNKMSPLSDSHNEENEVDLNEEDLLVTLVDEEGHEEDFYIVQLLTIDTHQYAMLVPAEEEEDQEEKEEEELLVMRYEDGQLLVIEDEAEFKRVAQAIEELEDEGEESDV